jgi:hypothetical protein
MTFIVEGSTRVVCRARSRRRSCSPRDVPDHIHDPLEDRGVGFGQLAPALRHARVVTQPPVVFGGNLVLASVLAQALDLLSEEQVFLLCRRSGMSARWLPGLEKSPHPQLEVRDSCECLNGEGLRRCFDAFDDALDECPSSRGGWRYCSELALQSDVGRLASDISTSRSILGSLRYDRKQFTSSWMGSACWAVPQTSLRMAGVSHAIASSASSSSHCFRFFLLLNTGVLSSEKVTPCHVWSA